MHVAGGDRRNARDEPALGAMRAERRRQLAGDRAELDPLQVQFRRGKMRLGMRRPRGAQTVDHLKEERGRGRASDEGSVALAVEIPDPDSEHVMVEDGHGPGVAESMRRSSFPKYGGGAVQIAIR